MPNKQNSSIKHSIFRPPDDEKYFEKHLTELREAIDLAETHHNIMAYYWAEERFAVLLCIIEEGDPARYEERISVADEILPTDWIFGMNVLENSWSIGGLFDPINRIIH